MRIRNVEKSTDHMVTTAGRCGAGAAGVGAWWALVLAFLALAGGGCIGAGRGVPLEERQKVEQRALLALTLATRDPAAAVRVQAIESLQEGAPRVGVRYFMEALEDEYPGVRFAALMALGSLRYAPARDMIRARLNDADPHVRLAARFAMSRMGDPSGVPEIVSALRTHRSAAVRGNAALILGRLGDAGAVGALRGALKEQDESVRLQVLEAMALLGDKKAVGELGLIAYSSTGPKMVLALLALGEARRSELRNLFLEQFESASYDEVRLAAAAALARIGEPVGAAYAQDRLRNYRPERSGVDTPEQQAARVRILATVVLGAARDPAAMPALDDALRNETNESVRVAAARAVLMIAGSVETGESTEVVAGKGAE